MQNEHVSDMEVPFKFREFLFFPKEVIKTRCITHIRSHCTYSFIRWFFFNWYKSQVFFSYYKVLWTLHTIGCIVIIRIIVLKFLLNYFLISGHLDCHFCATSDNTIWFSLAQIPGLSFIFFLFFFFFWRQLTSTSITVSKIRIFVIRLTILSFLENFFHF